MHEITKLEKVNINLLVEQALSEPKVNAFLIMQDNYSVRM